MKVFLCERCSEVWWDFLVKSCGFGKFLFKFKSFFTSVYIVHKKRTQTFFMKNIFKNFSRNICEQKFSCVQNSLGFVIVVDASSCGLVYKLGQKIPSQSVKIGLYKRQSGLSEAIYIPLVNKAYQAFLFRITIISRSKKHLVQYHYIRSPARTVARLAEAVRTA